jgi:very-short-patch-repair endonuclease
VVELLSFTYHAMFLDRLADEERFARMERAGFAVLRVWDTDVWNRPDETAANLVRFSMELAAARLRA